MIPKIAVNASASFSPRVSFRGLSRLIAIQKAPAPEREEDERYGDPDPAELPADAGGSQQGPGHQADSAQDDQRRAREPEPRAAPARAPRNDEAQELRRDVPDELRRVGVPDARLDGGRLAERSLALVREPQHPPDGLDPRDDRRRKRPVRVAGVHDEHEPFPRPVQRRHAADAPVAELDVEALEPVVAARRGRDVVRGRLGHRA
ncbi:MAG TPA: hypothetical protein VHH55_08195 [Gaiellaceae bacterium]|nr:hypothetical protein [Gaiellaceae bacterium]